MDQGLIDYCFDEIAHDGDLGSTIARLTNFIAQYYVIHPSPDPAKPSAVFDMLRNLDKVIVGLAPESDMEVAINPEDVRDPKKMRRAGGLQLGAASPAKTNGPRIGRWDALTLSPLPDNARPYDIGALSAQHGDLLRIAVDPETCYLALTGQTGRHMAQTNSRMWTVLQFIARSRVEGVTSDHLAQLTKFDHKVVYGKIRQGIALGLIFKVNKIGAKRGDHTIHKDYRDLVPSNWIVRNPDEEEAPAASGSRDESAVDGDDDGDESDPSERAMTKPRQQPPPLLPPAARMAATKDTIVAVVTRNHPTPMTYVQLFTAVFPTATETEWSMFCDSAEIMARDGKIRKILQPFDAVNKILLISLPNGSPPDPIALTMKPPPICPVARPLPPGQAKKRLADQPPNGESAAKRLKAGGTTNGKARETTPPWATTKKNGARPPSPQWVPKRAPTPPWQRAPSPPPRPPPRLKLIDAPKLRSMSPKERYNFAAKMIFELETHKQQLKSSNGFLTPDDLRSLLPGKTFTLTVIDFLMTMMSAHASLLPDVTICPTAVYSRIEKAKATGSQEAWDQVLKFYKSKDIFKYHRIVLPVLLKAEVLESKEDRWICSCVDFRSKTLAIYDSLAGPDSSVQHPRYSGPIRHLSAWLNKEASARGVDPPDWKVWRVDSTPKGTIAGGRAVDSAFYTWLFARELVTTPTSDMNFADQRVERERCWLIIDGCQSLVKVPLPEGWKPKIKSSSSSSAKSPISATTPTAPTPTSAGPGNASPATVAPAPSSRQPSVASPADASASTPPVATTARALSVTATVPSPVAAGSDIPPVAIPVAPGSEEAVVSADPALVPAPVTHSSSLAVAPVAETPAAASQAIPEASSDTTPSAPLRDRTLPLTEMDVTPDSPPAPDGETPPVAQDTRQPSVDMDVSLDGPPAVSAMTA